MVYKLVDFKKDVQNIQPIDEKLGTTPWQHHVKNFKNYIIDSDCIDFLREPVISGTMFVGNTDAIHHEYKYLVEHKEWPKIKKAIKDPGFGNPVRYLYNPNTSGNYIHCAYHLMQFQERMNYRINELEYIVELGAGYGTMCNVARGLGFKGKYYLFDLPLFSLLQKYYLSEVCSENNNYVTDIDELEIIDIPNGLKSMVISTWALSEMPVEYRQRLFNFCPRFKHMLFAFQSAFEKMKIWAEFEAFQKSQPKFSWQTFLIEHMDNEHKYMFGSNFYE